MAVFSSTYFSEKKFENRMRNMLLPLLFFHHALKREASLEGRTRHMRRINTAKRVGTKGSNSLALPKTKQIWDILSL